MALGGGGPQKPTPQGCAKGPASWVWAGGGRAGRAWRLSPGRAGTSQRGPGQSWPTSLAAPGVPVPLTAEVQLCEGDLSPWQFPLEASVMRPEGKHRGDSSPDLEVMMMWGRP